MKPISVAVEGVTSLLANLNPSKASGPDGIPARFLEDMANDLAPSLTLIYQDNKDVFQMSGMEIIPALPTTGLFP